MPHAIAPSLDAIVPVPAPFLVVVSVYCFFVNVAVTFAAADSVTVQAPVPLHAPPQPAKSASLADAAVSVTAVP